MDAFTLSGSYGTTPLAGETSGIPFLATPLAETLNLSAKQFGEYSLNSDAAQAVAFGGVSPANVIIMKVTSGPAVKARITWGSNVTQAIEVDGSYIQIDKTTGITALDLTRTPGQISVVEVFLGQAA